MDARPGTALWLALPAVGFAAASRLPGPLELGSPDFAAARMTVQEARSPRLARPERIASASLLSDELLLELAPSRLASVSYVADDVGVTPVASRFPQSIPRVSGSAEQLIALRADLVVLSDYSAVSTAAWLEAAGHAVYRVRAVHTFDALLAEIRRLGRAIGADAPASVLATGIELELAALRRQAGAGPRPRVLLLDGTYAYAHGTLQHDCLARAGLRNALDRLGLRGTPDLSSEALLAADPDFIAIAWETPEPRPLAPEEWPAGYPWRFVRAAAAGAIYGVPRAVMASISHHALAACRAYVALARRSR